MLKIRLPQLQIEQKKSQFLLSVHFFLFLLYFTAPNTLPLRMKWNSLKYWKKFLFIRKKPFLRFSAKYWQNWIVILVAVQLCSRLIIIKFDFHKLVFPSNALSAPSCKALTANVTFWFLHKFDSTKQVLWFGALLMHFCIFYCLYLLFLN